MRIFAGFLKARARGILLYAVTLGLLKLVFFLYNLPSDALNYGFLLVLVLAGILFFIDFCEFYKRHKKLVLVEKNMQDALLDLPEPDTLIENDYQDWFDQIWLVAVSPQVQCQRLMKRNHLSAEEAGMRIASQMPLAEKLPYASLVIDNNGNIDDLKKKVKGAIKDLANLV